MKHCEFCGEEDTGHHKCVLRSYGTTEQERYLGRRQTLLEQQVRELQAKLSAPPPEIGTCVRCGRRIYLNAADAVRGVKCEWEPQCGARWAP